MQTEELLGKFDQGHVIDDSRGEHAAGASADSDSDEALVNRLHDDERRLLPALVGNGQDPEPGASGQMTIAQH